VDGRIGAIATCVIGRKSLSSPTNEVSSSSEETATQLDCVTQTCQLGRLPEKRDVPSKAIDHVVRDRRSTPARTQDPGFRIFRQDRHDFGIPVSGSFS
jgi:hypothetical protein